MQKNNRKRHDTALAATLLVSTLTAGSAHAELAPLRTAAVLSGRPQACAPRLSEGDVWQAAAHAGSQAHAEACAALARASARPDTESAVKTPTPPSNHHTAPRSQSDASFTGLLQRVGARKVLARGDAPEALRLFRAAAEQQPLSRWEPAAVHDYAVAAALTGSFALAADLYRQLVVVQSWLGARQRQALAIEAAVAVLRAPNPSWVEVQGYLNLLPAAQSDSGLAAVVGVLRNLTDILDDGKAAAAPQPHALSTEVTRRMARLTEQDRDFLVRWAEWLRTHDPDVLGDLSAKALPEPYLVAVRLARGSP